MKMKEYFQFKHPNDITIGKGRVVYASTYEAWALPGGEKTKDRTRAEAVAKEINEIALRQEEAARRAVR
jgi:ADP-ribose pyrophosphatase YjhB (NUDIX family)